MQGVKKMRVVIAACISLSGVVGAEVVEKPTVLPDAMISITVSDLHGFIDGLGNVASSVSPMANGMMIKNMLGMQLGDPGLTGIAPGKGLAVVAVDPTNVFAVVEVSAAQLGMYTNALAAKGVAFKSADGTLVVGQTPAAVDKGIGLVAEVEGKLLAKRKPVLRIDLQPAALIEKNQAQVDSTMQMMPMMMGMGMMQSPGMDPAAMQGVLKIVEGELHVMLSLAKQCDAAEIALSPGNGSLRLSETYVAKPGTHLAKLLNAPVVTTLNPKVQAGLMGKDAIAVDGMLSNPEAWQAFVDAELNGLWESMGLTAEEYKGIGAMIDRKVGITSGPVSKTFGFGGDSFIHMNAALGVKDEAAALEMLKSTATVMAPIVDLYKSLGMELSVNFKENVREHADVKIHQFNVSVKMPEEKQAVLQAMHIDLSNLHLDIAICDGLMLYAMGGTKIETLIDRVKDDAFKPEPLKARGDYPAGGFYYCDFNVEKYLSGLTAVLPKDPNNPLPQIVSMLQGADPVTSAGFREDGMVMFSVNVPGSLLTKIGQVVMTLQMQQMQVAPQNDMPTNNPEAASGDVPENMEPAPQP